MTVAYAARTPFVGSREHREEDRQPWDRVAGNEQGPVPWTLAAPTPTEEEIDAPPAPEPPPEKKARPSCRRQKLTPEQLSAINRRCSLARWHGKEKIPCRTCGEPTVSNGRLRRKCPNGHYQAQEERPQRLPWSACPHCGGETSSNGFTRSGKRVLVCRRCKKSHRVDAGKRRREG